MHINGLDRLVVVVMLVLNAGPKYLIVQLDTSFSVKTILI